MSWGLVGVLRGTGEELLAEGKVGINKGLGEAQPGGGREEH